MISLMSVTKGTILGHISASVHPCGELLLQESYWCITDINESKSGERRRVTLTKCTSKGKLYKSTHTFVASINSKATIKDVREDINIKEENKKTIDLYAVLKEAKKGECQSDIDKAASKYLKRCGEINSILTHYYYKGISAYSLLGTKVK